MCSDTHEQPAARGKYVMHLNRASRARTLAKRSNDLEPPRTAAAALFVWPNAERGVTSRGSGRNGALLLVLYAKTSRSACRARKEKHTEVRPADRRAARRRFRYIPNPEGRLLLIINAATYSRREIERRNILRAFINLWCVKRVAAIYIARVPFRVLYSHKSTRTFTAF